MLITTDYIEPVELTGYVRAAFADLPENQFQLQTWLPNDNIDDLDYRLSRGNSAGLAEAAAYRAFDAESPLGSRPGVGRISGELPPMSQKIRLGEYDRLRSRRANNDQVREAILADADRMVRGIAARMELARSDALVNGSVTIAENGLELSVDFGRKASHEVVAATLWSAAGADPLADLLAWQDVYVATNGDQPGTMLISRRIFSTLMRNEAVRNLVFPGANQPSLVTEQAVSDALNAFGLPPIRRYDAQVSVNGTAQRVTPDSRMLFLPAAGSTTLGATLFGTTAESLESEFGLAGSEPGLVAGSYSEKDPVALWTKAAAIGLPVLANPDQSFVATVL